MRNRKFLSAPVARSAFRNVFAKLQLLAMMAICFVCSTAGAQTAPPVEASVPQLSAPQIVSNMVSMNEKRAAALKTYTAQRTYELDYSGFLSHKHAKMIVDVTYKSPNDKKLTIVSEEGSELLRNRVLHNLVESEMEANDRGNKAGIALNEQNYEFTLSGSEQKDGRNCFVLGVKPRTRSKYLYEGKVWVDAEDFAVVHIQARPAKNPSFWIKRVDIEHQYRKFGSFWLPLNNQSISSTRFGGQAVLVIDYGSYNVEPGGSSAVPGIATTPAEHSDHIRATTRPDRP